jgi:hypothetical protein
MPGMFFQCRHVFFWRRAFQRYADSSIPIEEELN